YFSPRFVEYANKHSIYAIIENLLKRLIISKPDDPIEFLINVLKHESINKPSIFILGPPCSGKYTLGEYVAQRLNSVEGNQDTESTSKARIYANFLKNRLAEDDCEKNGYVLTGYPTTLEEGKALQRSGIFPEKIIVLDAPDKILKERAALKINESVNNEPSLDSEDITSAGKSEDLTYLNSQVVDYRHHFTTLSRIYMDKIIPISADRSLNEVFHRTMCHLSRPPRNSAIWTPRVLLLGFSGSGRKTVAEKLEKKYNLIPVHCGTLIRREVIRETKLGMDMKPYTDSHSAVPDEMVIDLLKTFLSEAACALKGWVLLGYPRTKLQAQALDETYLSPNRVIFLDINRADAITRLKSRKFGEQHESHYNTPRRSWIWRQPYAAFERVNFKFNRFAARRIELDEYYGNRALYVDADKDEETVFENVEYLIVNELPRLTFPE
ncbi:unnamed protein product, partial [Hymenolepis diminuta]